MGQPFEFDFNYAAALPPALYSWCKNGKDFSGDGLGGRVTVEYTGISFTHVLPTDAGQYSVKASVESGLVTATSTLNGETNIFGWVEGGGVLIESIMVTSSPGSNRIVEPGM